MSIEQVVSHRWFKVASGVFAACVLLWMMRKAVLFPAVVVGVLLVYARFRPLAAEKILLAATLAVFSVYVLFPGIATHVWHKLSARNFDAVVQYLKQEAQSREHLYLWSATSASTNACDTAIMHNFQMSEVLRHVISQPFTFVPAPHFKREDCIKGVRAFRGWQTKFFPEALVPFETGIEVGTYLVLVPESYLEVVLESLRKAGKKHRVLYAAESGRGWHAFYDLMLLISRFTNEAPGYLVLEAY